MKNAALVLRADTTLHPGGDTVQAEALALFLQGRGLEVQRLEQLRPSCRAEMGILFNLTRPFETFVQSEALRRVGIPYVLFPVYWDLERMVPQPPPRRRWPTALRFSGPRAGLAFLRSLPGDVAAWLLAHPRARHLASPLAAMRSVVAGAALVAPNSQAEADHLAEKLGLAQDRRWVVVGNGLWAAEMPPPLPVEQRSRAVLCVGAIGPRKNQLALMRAAQGLDCPVRLIGRPAPGCEDYARQVAAEAPANVEWLGPLPRAQVLELLASSRVHCQPSFIETPGLASLEAAACGCVPVVSAVAPVREYFGEDAYYADPHDPASIRRALQMALEDSQPPAERASDARLRFDWSAALEPLARALGV